MDLWIHLAEPFLASPWFPDSGVAKEGEVGERPGCGVGSPRSGIGESRCHSGRMPARSLSIRKQRIKTADRVPYPGALGNLEGVEFNGPMVLKRLLPSLKERRVGLHLVALQARLERGLEAGGNARRGVMRQVRDIGG